MMCELITIKLGWVLFGMVNRSNVREMKFQMAFQEY